MRQKRSPSEIPGKGEVVADKPLTKAQTKEAMVRFESLTRRLLGVSRKQLQAEQDRYENDKKTK